VPHNSQVSEKISYKEDTDPSESSSSEEETDTDSDFDIEYEEYLQRHSN